MAFESRYTAAPVAQIRGGPLHRPGQCRTRSSILLGLCLIGLQACATLPDARELADTPHDAQVDFENASGPVSDATSNAVIERLEGKDGASDVLQKHLAFEQSVNADSPLVLDNKVTLLQNGPATYEAMFKAIRDAEDHINLETFIFEDGEIGQKFSELLQARQRAGVQVNVIYDSVGGLFTPEGFFERMRDSGIRVVEFNPINPLTVNAKPWLINNRDHRKLLVVDGRIAFTGGINISETYSSAPSKGRSARQRKAVEDTGGWRDTHVQIEGPVVAEFQKLFIGTWRRQNGPMLPARDYFPELKPRGKEIVRAIGSTPTDEHSLIYVTLLSAISHAEKEISLTIAYFAPDKQLLDALKDAAKRGVKVSLIMPSYTDSWAIFHLGRSYYTQLLAAGVQIYERRGAVMHAKTACIDGVWSTVGSTNLDWRSFLHNDEVNAVILGQGFATQMQAIFADDRRESTPITLEKWRRRSLLDRIKERSARVGAYWL